MKGCSLAVCRLLTLGFLIGNLGAHAAANRLTDAVIANKLHISVQQLHGLRARFDLENDQILALTPIQLQDMLDELSRPGIDLHAEEQEFRAQRFKDENGHIPMDGLPKAIKEHRGQGHNPHDEGEEEDLFPGLPDPSTNEPYFGISGSGLAGIQTNGWTWLGPGNIGGRLRSILIHPTQTNIMWCGGVDGGVWKTTNSGAAWFPLNDYMANLAISCMVMSPTNPNVIYAGTGESTYNIDAIRGAGIFKTTDGGATWTQLSATLNSSYQYVSRLAMDQTGQILLAATRSGIFRSIDGGTSWSQRSSTEMRVVAFAPADSTNSIASGYDGKAFYSTDGGLTWLAATGLPTASGINGRVEVAYARSNPTTVYASVDSSSGQLYASSDGGRTYTLRNTGNNYLSGQGWYANALWVDPTTTNVVVVGGLDIWRSTDGGATFNRISQWQSAPSSAHADHHVIVENPAYNGSTVRTVYFGDDGGFYRANDVMTVSQTSGWQSLNNNLGITQFYGGAGNPASGAIVGGTQDNGSLRYTPSGGTGGWTAMFGGDGGFAAADQTDPNYFYGEYVYLQIHRSGNGGGSSIYIYSGISDAGNGSTANFISPYILDPNNQSTMLAGGVSLWRSTNVKASPPTWSAIKTPTSGNSPISAIAVAPGNSAVIWVGHNNGDVYATANGTSATPTWVQKDLGSPNLPNRYCERIAISPTNANKVYVTFGGFSSPNVWRTTDGGTTWSSISTGLPAAPVNAITIAPTDPNTLYIGTEVGIYGSPNDGATWSTGNDGPANVSVDELFWMSNKLVAVTHGRGMFVTTPLLGPAALSAAGSTISSGNGNGLIDPNECNQLNLMIQNIGGLSATNINAVLSTTTPGVNIVRGNAAYPNLAGGATGTNATPFQITTLPSFVCGTPIAIMLTATFNNTTNTLNFTVGTTTYAVTQTTGATLVPGTTDIGNHGDDSTVTIGLPFNYTFYGQSYSAATIDSNGKLHFNNAPSGYNNTCLPTTSYPNTIFPFWDDLDLSSTGGGIFTSTSGTAPNRIFNIEWRALVFDTGVPVNFEVRLYEGQQRIDFVYGALSDNGGSATVGIEKDSTAYTAFECNSGGLIPGLQLTFLPTCTDGGGICAPFVNFTGAPVGGAAPLQVIFSNLSGGATNYNWDFGDGNFSSLTNPTNMYATAGTYSVSLTAVGPGGTNSFTRTSYIVVTNAPPAISGQPQSLAVAQGAGAPFSVTASGTPPLSYEWRFAGTAIPGATDSAYTRTNSQCADAGGYDVVVSNIAGNRTSVVATLTVIAPPGIAAQPADQTIMAGQTATFTVTATNACGGPLNYQWQKAGANLSGATASTFSKLNAQPADSGSYSVIVSNLAGSVTSSVATLTVTTPAQLVVFPAGLDFGSVFTGLTAQASLVISNSGMATLNGSASLTPGPFALLDESSNAVTNLSFAVAPSAATNIGVSFTPPSASNFSNQVAFASNGGNSTNALTGQGLEAPVLLSPSLTTDGLVFSFNTVTGKTYVIQYKDDLSDPIWQPLQTNTGDGTLKVITNSVAVPAQRFYRLSTQ